MSHPLSPVDFKRRAKVTLEERPDGPLPYKTNTAKAVAARDRRVEEWPDFAERRSVASLRREEDIDNLEELHNRLRDVWKWRGIVVHEAADANAARKAVLELVRKAGVDRIIKSKTMLSEEIELNSFLADNGVTAVETDLGEYIVQLRNELPSHITMPAMHLTRQDIGKLFAEKLDVEYTEDPAKLTKIARKALRKEFLAAEVGLCGVNFAIAETGHLATVTNEGNGRMVTTMPNIVIALMGWERVTRSLADAARLWELLARSATGQRATVYLNLLAGPSIGQAGPNEVHVVMVDNGRRAIYDDPEMRPMLRCIHCGACLNVCPVYRQIGGHPYGGVYPGPMGQIFTPLLGGLDNAPDHPFASTLCGACEEICPVSIRIPELLLKLRGRQVESRTGKQVEHALWSMFREVMSDSRRYEAASTLARTFQRIMPGRKLPIPGWTDHRDAPDFAGRSFRDQFADREEEDE